MALFEIVAGVPHMDAEIRRLTAGLEAGTLDRDERDLARKLFKAIANLARNPSHPGLASHEIEPLTKRFSTAKATRKVFESYLENNTPGAARLFWTYGPARGMITLVGMQPHPEDRKNSGYARVQLSKMPTPADLAKARK